MNNNYQPPANFPGPQDPQSKYPHLPPAQPNQAFPSQQNPANMPPSQNNQGYALQNQYAIGRANHIELDPRTQLSYKISQIEKSLDNGCFFCYKLWVWFVIIASFIGVFFSITELYKLVAYQSSEAIRDSFMLFGLPFILIWVIYQNYLVRKAMVEKDLNAAKKAMGSMILFSVVSTACLLYVIDSFPSYRRQQAMESLGLQIGLPIAIDVFGASKVQRALQEREELSKKLETHSVNVNVNSI